VKAKPEHAYQVRSRITTARFSADELVPVFEGYSMLLLRRGLLVMLTMLLRRMPPDFPGRWRLERFAVSEIREIGPSLRPIVVSTRDGFAIWADPAEWVGQYIYATGRYEENTVALMSRLLQPGDCFIDVGANIGYLTLLGARLVRPTGSVIAFEPLPSARMALERNVALNDAAHVVVRGDAVCDRTGTATLNIGPDHHTSISSLLPVPQHRDEAAVSCVRLDDVVSARRVRLIKIDVEGAEHLVVEGASRTLDTHAPDLIVELNGPEVGDALRRRGYSAFALDGTGLGEVTGQVNALFTKHPRHVHT
jgi:FkbM family methyltransferase